MSGVMAGTTILSATAERATLGTVTLTINSVCNLRCPHCYLDDENSGTIGEAVIEAVLASSCDHISIVGKEPFANRDSIACVGRIVDRASGLGKTVSVITNGLNGGLVPVEILERLAWIDVSVDGGAESYEQYRGGSWARLRRAIKTMHQHGTSDLRVLQTLSRRTVTHIDDMVASSRMLGAKLIMFSPYRPTRTFGTQSDAPLEPTELVQSLVRYAKDDDIRLSIDSDYAAHFGDISVAVDRARTLMGERFCYVPNDPIRRGIIRVTHDGKVMSPLRAIHMRDYAQQNMTIGRDTLDTLFLGLHGGTEASLLIH
jgi:MoaA/NifB/PqqE/SkfB family radical SAM enzyme